MSSSSPWPWVPKAELPGQPSPSGLEPGLSLLYSRPGPSTHVPLPALPGFSLAIRLSFHKSIADLQILSFQPYVQARPVCVSTPQLPFCLDQAPCDARLSALAFCA